MQEKIEKLFSPVMHFCIIILPGIPYEICSVRVSGFSGEYQGPKSSGGRGENDVFFQNGTEEALFFHLFDFGQGVGEDVHIHTQSAEMDQKFRHAIYEAARIPGKHDEKIGVAPGAVIVAHE